MGGVDRVLTEAETQLTENPQWAAELASMALYAESSDERAKLLKAAALRTMAADMINPNARNWYLTEALELEGKIGIEPRPVDDARLKYAQSFPIENILEMMRVSLNPAKTEGVNATMAFTFPDQSKRFLLTVRNNVLLIDPIDELPTDTVEVELNASDWVALITQHDSFPAALASGRLRVVNGVTDISAVIRFLSMFAN
jgi:alkyl sulfatase BDS1-like metallo-beta-lactamase superfamily hydrolase